MSQWSSDQVEKPNAGTDFILLMDASGTILAKSATGLETALNLPSRERNLEIGMNYFHFLETLAAVGPIWATQALEKLQQMARGELPEFEIQLSFRGLDREEWCQLRGTRTVGSKGDILVVTQRNITKRICGAYPLRNHTGPLQALKHLPDITRTLDSLLNAALKISGMDCGGIYFADDQTGLRLAAFNDPSICFLKEVENYAEENLYAQLLSKGKPIYARSVELESLFIKSHCQERLKALAVIPILFEDHVVGCLNLASRTLEEVPAPIRLALENIASTIGLVLDKSLSHEKLRLNQDRFRVALATAPIVVFNQDRELRYTWVGNPALGAKEEDSLGRTDEDLLGEEIAKPLTRFKRRVLATGQGDRQEVFITHAGQSGWFDLMAEPLRNADGQIEGITCAAVDITRRKQSEQVALESREQFRTLVEQAPEGIFIQTRQRFAYVNPAFVRLLGYSHPEQLLGELVENRFHPDCRIQVRNRIQQLNEQHLQVPTLEEQLLRSDGSSLSASVSAVPFRFQGESGALVFVRDITERKRMEDALRESEERFRILFSHMVEGVALYEGVYDELNQPINYRLMEVNASYERILGLKRDSVVGKLATEVYGVASAPYLKELAAVGETGQACFFETFFAPLNLHFAISAAPLGYRRWATIFTDITARKKTEAALYERENQLQLFVQYSPAAIAMLDQNMRYLVVSRRWMSDFRIGDEPITGKSHYELFPNLPKRWLDIHRRCLAGAIEKCEADSFSRMDGTVDWVRWEIRPWRASSDQIGGIIIFSELITEQKRLEAERAAALARLSEVEEHERLRFARELHDQTAQRLVALAIELKNLEINMAAGRPQTSQVHALRKSVDDLQQQVRQMAWDLRAGEVMQGGLDGELHTYLQEWAERSLVPVDFECRGFGGNRLPPRIEATLYRVAQEALANVERHAHANRVAVLLECDVSLVRLTVEDDGCGFDLDAVEKTFRPAQRLGLLGMKERVMIVGGTLLVESMPGTGTTILVRIPLKMESNL